jgi:enoyl-CoA hydratase/carnithine racemase
MELALTGDLIDAERAERLGLVNRLVDSGEALGCALGLAARIARNAPLAVRASKDVIGASGQRVGSALWELQEARLQEVLASEDAGEGVAAFNAKRRPVWRAR